jgi:hypothetical protein
MSEISEGNKFSMAIGSGTYTTGVLWYLRTGIWKEDITDPVTGKYPIELQRSWLWIRVWCMNKEPALEKVLDNIRMITNETCLLGCLYIWTAETDAVNIWGSVPEIEFETKTLLEGKWTDFSPILHSRWKHCVQNSGLYIEVGRISQALYESSWV